jgi:hypothetical protein
MELCYNVSLAAYLTIWLVLFFATLELVLISSGHIEYHEATLLNWLAQYRDNDRIEAWLNN